MGGNDDSISTSSDSYMSCSPNAVLLMDDLSRWEGGKIQGMSASDHPVSATWLIVRGNSNDQNA